MLDHIKPYTVCRDGFIVSIQASQYHYCEPQNNTGPYESYELGYPSEVEPLLTQYAEDKNDLTHTVYAYVPAAVVKRVIAKHGGLEE